MLGRRLGFKTPIRLRNPLSSGMRGLRASSTGSSAVGGTPSNHHQQSSNEQQNSSGGGHSDAGSGGSGSGSGSGSGDSDSSSSGWRKWVGAIVLGSLGGVSFMLGVWQVQRRAWKLDLISDRESRLAAPPTPLHAALTARAANRGGGSGSESGFVPLELEFRRVSLSGTYDYPNQFVIGLRSAPASYAESKTRPNQHLPLSTGYYVVTPFRLAESGDVVMINRGWVDRDRYELASRSQRELTASAALPSPNQYAAAYLMDSATVSDAASKSKSTTATELVGVLRPSDSRPQYLPASYDPATASGTGTTAAPFLYGDVSAMYRLYQTKNKIVLSPTQLFVDAIEPVNSPAGAAFPIRRSTSDYVSWHTTPQLHIIYAVTWFSLAVCVWAGTYIRFRKRPNLPRPPPATTH